MAEARLIDAYLTELAYSVRDLDDADDIVDEAADHLACAMDAGLSEAEALARFGSAPLVSRVFAEEAKRGGAVSTRRTRLAGMAAIITVPFALLGVTMIDPSDKGYVHHTFLTMEVTAVFTFGFAVWGMRKRHGGLGRSGRVAFWLFVVAPFASMPFGYAAAFAWAAHMLVVLALLGVGMLDAGILPRVPVVLFTLTPVAIIMVAAVMIIAGIDIGPWQVMLLSPVGVGFVWLGWAMWREPALDARGGRDPIGPLAA